MRIGYFVTVFLFGLGCAEIHEGGVASAVGPLFGAWVSLWLSGWLHRQEIERRVLATLMYQHGMTFYELAQRTHAHRLLLWNVLWNLHSNDVITTARHRTDYQCIGYMTGEFWDYALTAKGERLASRLNHIHAVRRARFLDKLKRLPKALRLGILRGCTPIV